MGSPEIILSFAYTTPIRSCPLRTATTLGFQRADTELRKNSGSSSMPLLESEQRIDDFRFWISAAEDNTTEEQSSLMRGCCRAEAIRFRHNTHPEHQSYTSTNVHPIGDVYYLSDT